jgi:ribonuclease D
MSLNHLPAPIHITTDKDLRDLVGVLTSAPVIAVDTESNSLYAYTGKVCLIQLSTRDCDYIIDPLTIEDMSPLGRLFASNEIEKVFHAAEYDIICLRRDFGFEVNRLFDTMYAARLVDGSMSGLGDLLQKHYGIQTNKKHQLDNWGMRPLPEDSLRYAQMDTHYLPHLRDHYHQAILAKGAWDEMAEVFEDIARSDGKEQIFDPDGYWKLVKPHELNKRQMAVLAELYQTRDAIAQEMDLPPFKVIENRVLVKLALHSPANRRELSEMRGLRSDLIRIYADDLLDAIDRGHQAPPPRPPAPERLDQVVADRYVVLHAWRKEKAAERQLESNMVVSKQTLWLLAERPPDTIDELRAVPGIGAWRATHYGEEILSVLHPRRKA